LKALNSHPRMLLYVWGIHDVMFDVCKRDCLVFILVRQGYASTQRYRLADHHTKNTHKYAFNLRGTVIMW
jgi:hypothetical protein